MRQAADASRWLVVTTAALACVAFFPSAVRAGTPRPVDEANLARIVGAAPKCPAELDMGLKIRLVDFVDFTDPADPHDFRDQGTSKVVSGPAGKYRVTAAHRHAFFSSAFRTAGRDKPVLLVVEYPDDAERIISFMTHDSMRAVREHTSFSQEAGVYTGGAMPLTKKRQYFTLISWPQDDWSPLIVLNFGRYGGAGAASRLWVYAIDEFSPPEIEAPDPAHGRTLDAFFPLSFLASRDNFGWQSPASIEHLCDYLKQIGLNRTTMMVYYAPGQWGPACTIPSWDSGEKKDLDDILVQMDRKGDIGLVAGFVTDGMYGDTLAGGKKVKDLPAEQARAVILKGLDEFLDRYGKYKSLRGIALGSMETIGFFDLLQSKGIAADAVAHIRKRRPDLEVITYVGNIYLQTPYFTGTRGSPTQWDVIRRWEAGDASWTGHLAAEVQADWKRWNHTPADLMKIEGLHVYEQTQPDDHRLKDLYPTEDPRQATYFDVCRSQELARVADTPYAAVFSLFTEGHIGLHKDLNFWYTKPWTGPDVNPAGPCRLFAFAQSLARHDRLAMSAGSWSVKYFGLEPSMRRFARAFRSLPPVVMSDVPGGPDTVVVRWAAYKGKRYVSLVNRTPFEQAVTVDGKSVTVPAYELVAIRDESADAPKLGGAGNPEYAAWVAARIAELRKVHAEVKSLDAEAAPQKYLKTAEQAETALRQGGLYAADTILGYALLQELKLRRDVLDRPALAAPRVAAAPPMTGDLDAWPKNAADIRAEGAELLAGHVFFPNSWTGPDDLSFRLRLAHDGRKLYVGVDVRDQKVAVDTVDSVGKAVNRPEGVTLTFSRSGYRDWRGDVVKSDVACTIPAPAGKAQIDAPNDKGFGCVVRRTERGYVVEGSISLEALGAAPGKAVGFLASVSDVDNTPNLMRETDWARKQTMLYPHKPNFPFWNDARNCGRLTLGE